MQVTTAVRARGRPRPPATRAVVAASALTAAVALGAAARLAVGAGQVNYDSLYSLVWGRTLARGAAPDFTAGSAPPTPHPLSTIVGAGLSVFGNGADAALLVVAFLALGAVGALALAAGRAWLGIAGGVVAAGLVLTRDTLLFYSGLAYFDVVFVALVVGAVAVELRRPRAGTIVLALLAIAGLWRPEAWVLSGVYWLSLVVGRDALRGRRRMALLAWAVAAPVLWLTFDLVVTGDPLYSLTYTQEAATDLGR